MLGRATGAAFLQVASQVVVVGGSNPCAGVRSRRRVDGEGEGGVHFEGGFGDGAVADDAGRDAGDGGAGRDVAEDDAAGGDFGADADLDVAEDFRARAEEHAAADFGVAVAALLCRCRRA